MEQITTANTFRPCPLWEAVMRLSAADYTTEPASDVVGSASDPISNDK